MSTVAQIRQQQQIAKEAYAAGTITKSQYAEFMVYSKAQEQQILNAQNAQSKVSAPLGGVPPVSGNWQQVSSQTIDPEAYAKAMAALSAGGPTTPVTTPSTVSAPLGNAPPPVAGNYKPVTEAPPATQKIAAEKKAALEAYTSIGKPELAMTYEAPNIPEGYILESATEVQTERGKALDVVIAPKPKPLGLGETAFVGLNVVEKVVLAELGLSQNELARQFFELGPLSLPYAAAGVFGTLESDVVGTASLFTSIGESVRVGNLTYKPAWDVQLSPTVLGGAVSWAFGGGEMRELTSRPWAYQFGAVVGEAGIVVLSSEATSAAWQRLRGVKVSKIAGAKEIEVSTGTGKTLESNRLTKLLIEEQRVPAGEAAKLREFSRYVNPERLALGGSELRVSQYVDDTVLYGSKGVEAFREASPYVETAAKISSSESGLLRRIGEKIGVVKSKSLFAGAVSKEYVDDLGSYAGKAIGVAEGGKGFVYSTERIVAQEALYPYGRSVASKTFTGAFVEGTIDTQTYLGLVKAVGPKIAQEWYPQMGGLASSLLEKAAPKTVSLTTKVVAVTVPSTVAARIAGVAGATIPQLVKPSRRTQSISLLLEPIEKKKPSVLTPIIEPSKKPVVPSVSVPIVKPLLPSKPTVITPIVEAPKTRRVSPAPAIAVPKPAPKLADRISDFVTQKPSQKLAPTVSLKEKTTQPQITRILTSTVTPTIPTLPKKVSPLRIPPPFRIGGSGGGAKGSGGFGIGRWYKKRNPVATVTQNLRVVTGVKPFRVKPKSRTSRKKKHKRRKGR